MSLSTNDPEQALTEELGALARDPRWQNRYRALERSLELPITSRRQIANHYVNDANAWVRSLAQTLSDAGAKPTLRSRRGIVHEFDQLLRGTKLTLNQRAGLIGLFEDAQEAGSIGYLALSADRAARLVTAALSGDASEQRQYLYQIERFVRHIAAYASPISLEDDVAPVSSVLAEVEGEHHVRLAVERSVDASVNRAALKFALDELVTNAEDAGATTVRLNLIRNNGEIRTLIDNDGEPIGSPAKNHLFEPWYTTRTGRAGLGLHLARATAREAGGELTTRSEAHSSFEIVLPVRE